MTDRALRIAIFSDSALPILNGVSVSIDSLVSELRNRGHSVHLFSTGYGGHRDPDPNVCRFFSVKTPWTKGYPLAVPPFMPYLARFLTSKFDLVHTHTPFTVGMVGLAWAKTYRLPVVSTYHTMYHKYSHYVPLPNKRYVGKRIARHTQWYYNQVQQVITPSEPSKRWLHQHNVETPISIIPTGVPLPRMLDRTELRAQLGMSPTHRILLYVGRIALEKNIDTLFRAAAHAFPRDPLLRLWVVGDGPQREGLAELARDLGIGDRVRFVGAVPREEVDRFYAAADLFTFTSMTETQGLVVVEAMSYGLPALVVQGGGAGEAVEQGVNGRLLPNNPEVFAKAIHEVFTDERAYAKLSDGARKTGRTYSIPATTDRVLEVYRAALGMPDEEFRLIPG